MTDVRDKVVLVTGGARGIGRLMAEKLSSLGASVVLWDIDAERLTEAANGISSRSHRDVHCYVCDVSDQDEVYSVAQRVKNEVGTVDILINNAGVVTGKYFLECSDEQIRRTMEVNTMSTFWTTRAFLPEMIQRGHGHLVSISSAAAMVGVAGLADYCASKAAVAAFDEALHMELRKTSPGIKTTVACPYFINTGMFAGVKTRFSWLLPILKEEYVAQRIVRAIVKNQRRVLMPRFLYFVPAFRLIPVRLYDSLANIFGLGSTMEHFVGRRNEERVANVPEECQEAKRN